MRFLTLFFVPPCANARAGGAWLVTRAPWLGRAKNVKLKAQNHSVKFKRKKKRISRRFRRFISWPVTLRQCSGRALRCWEKKGWDLVLFYWPGLCSFVFCICCERRFRHKERRRTANKGISQPGRQGGEETRVMISSSQIALVSLFYSFWRPTFVRQKAVIRPR